MKIINCEINKTLWNAGQIFCVGYASGPVRALTGLVQAIVNFVPAIFLIIPSLCNLIDSGSKLHASRFIIDCKLGIGHILRGIIETLPFTSFVFKHRYKPFTYQNGTYGFQPFNDHPFELISYRF